MVEMKVLRVELRALGGALVLLQEKRGSGSVVPMVVGDAEGNAAGDQACSETSALHATATQQGLWMLTYSACLSM